MRYFILGRPRNFKKGKELVIDELDDRASADLEIYKMQGEMPSWLFWIDERSENDEKIQQGFCAEPEPPV